MSKKELRMIMQAIQELKESIEAMKAVAPEEVLIDSYQMERLLMCSSSTLRRLRKNGAIPSNKIGRRYYYPKTLFTQEFLNSISKGEDTSKRFDDR